MNEATTAKVKELLATPKKIVVVGHKNPDGDAVGSCLALAHVLNSLEHEATVVMPNDFPDFLKWLPDCDSILIHDKAVEKSKKLISDADLIFTLDFNALDRTGEMEIPLKETTAKYVLIDHHQQPDDYAAAVYSDTAMSSTCEMVYHFLDAIGALHLITSEVATQLYTGIMTDTGSFRFPATSATTHRVIAHLIECGVKNTEIHQNIYDTNTPDRIALLGVALQNMKILPEYRTAYITISQKELDDHRFKKGDTEGFVNYALSVTGVVFAVIFIENRQEQIVKISFRSKGSFSVNEFARKYYSGGGHTNAAGGKSTKSLRATVTEFISILPSHKNELTDES
ncbi:MAG: bifunctional oligoribonuclease/PAP phosphatase NrnA [Bacteroidia bacterium]|nr:bifunctional oligoribonuclease/PAP phosphatase NrnA [Bacteroidia bacterium]NNF30147.1 bifunctional oligoribonuclease/PAP phosphatase NrnA [Flavobacteriaceae bacterium]MBT8275025.1 bifunctional oligoribonuclease/PAP phosphatase NrnA [Bacteroidia bacterium]NNJ81793.1 bifunctional oligoribonuclease/PAP phosphatase NrnA [Flavobacteriaceae bacterium]NNK55489.1 bifunctional oligoribonuclease/PAP phosphatase NrnA [Flavobacteriaceae bacterium]